jgi:hypothetical protein
MLRVVFEGLIAKPWRQTNPRREQEVPKNKEKMPE